jgi:hypothetical protein
MHNHYNVNNVLKTKEDKLLYEKMVDYFSSNEILKEIKKLFETIMLSLFGNIVKKFIEKSFTFVKIYFNRIYNNFIDKFNEFKFYIKYLYIHIKNKKFIDNILYHNKYAGVVIANA